MRLIDVFASLACRTITMTIAWDAWGEARQKHTAATLESPTKSDVLWLDSTHLYYSFASSETAILLTSLLDRLHTLSKSLGLADWCFDSADSNHFKRRISGPSVRQSFRNDP